MSEGRLKAIRRALEDFRNYRMEHGGMEGDVDNLYYFLIQLIETLEKKAAGGR